MKKRNYNQYKKDRCEACGFVGSSFNPLTIDHIKTRGSGGKDEPYNCMTLCLSCHTEKGVKGISHMAKKYPNYKKFLLAFGWEFDNFLKKWINYKGVENKIKRQH